MNVLIVEDNPPFRIFLRKIIQNAGYNVFVAEDGYKAWDIILKEKIDALVTDWMMPQMNGIELIAKIRSKFTFPPVIIIVTALALKEAFDKAMQIGADDYLSKPVTKESVIHSLEKCLARRGQEPVVFTKENIQTKDLPNYFGVGIAASTGGPMTIMSLLRTLKPGKEAAYFVLLHGPGWMLKSFAERSNSECPMPVHLGENNLKIEPGHVYVSPGDFHMIIDKETFTLRLDDSPPENFVKPAADPLFRSIASSFGAKSVAIVLTGMGHDGTIGAGYIKTAGGFVIAQNPETAIISSMPKSVVDLRLADKVLKIENISFELEKYFENN